MIRICSWCKIEMEPSENPDDFKEGISHGLCDNCFNNIFFQQGVNLSEYLDSLKMAVIAVNPEGVVVTANDSACNMLKKNYKQVEGYLGGDVFECQYARLPEGCGKTIHCSGCTIRRTVMETFSTGKKFSKIPASLRLDESRENQEIHFLISTEKIGDIVLLEIEKLP